MKQYAILMIVFGLLALFACAGTQSGGTGTKTDAMQITPQRLKDITGIEWHLKKMKMADKSISLIEDSKTTLSCNDEGKVAGVASINRYSGNFKIGGDGTIIWNKAFIMTRMAGPPKLMEQETAYMQALAQTSRMHLEGPRLTLINKNGSTRLEFKKPDN